MAPRSVLPADVADRWLALEMFGDKPMEPQLSGLELEYRIVLLYSRDRAKREAQIGAHLGPATQDIGFRNRAAVLFDIAPSHDVTLPRARRERAAGRRVVRRPRPRRTRLPGAIEAAGAGFLLPGPDLSRRRRDRAASCGSVHGDVWPRARIRSRDAHRHASTALSSRSLDFTLRRWIDPPAHGWYSGDHHIHAAGCSHYESPTEGVRPEDMMRQVLGEALSVGVGAELGTELLSPAPVFRGQGQQGLDRVDAAALRRRDLGIPVEPLRPPRAAARARSGLSRCPADRRLAVVGSADSAVGEGAGGDHRVRTLGPGAAGREPRVSRTTRCRRSTAIGANEYIMDVTHDVGGFHLHGGHAVRPRAEYLVPHAQLRIQDPRQRRDGLPLHRRTTVSARAAPTSIFRRR